MEEDRQSREIYPCVEDKLNVDFWTGTRRLTPRKADRESFCILQESLRVPMGEGSPHVGEIAWFSDDGVERVRGRSFSPRAPVRTPSRLELELAVNGGCFAQERNDPGGVITRFSFSSAFS